MTDKQNFENDINTPHKKHACDICGAYYCNGDDCRLYNEYTEKEQECERLKESIEENSYRYAELDADYDQLKAENEELKSVRDSWISKCEQETKIKELYQDGLDQLKQSIARVKELIQKEISDCEHCDDCTSCGYNCCIRQAMQVCDEVISE